MFLHSWLALIGLWPLFASAQMGQASSRFTIARLHYSGGGDWYNDPSIIPNMLEFLRKNSGIDAAQDEARITINSEELFSYSIIFMTGHGRISFSADEAVRLRNYLTHGGFLYADDDYGMDVHFRREMKKVFPDKEMVELPFSQDLYHIQYDFPKGLPKIHEHDGGPPHGFGYFHEGRLVVFYTFDTNISDGWADPEVHGDAQNVRDLAFRMGANIIIYALMN